MPAAFSYQSDPVPRALLSKEGCQRYLAECLLLEALLFSWALSSSFPAPRLGC